MTFRTTRLFTSLTATAGLLLACGNDLDSVGAPEESVFESDNPGGAANRGTTGEAADTSGSGGTASLDGGSKDGEASRAIEEADIIKIEGSRLYALSQYGGLNIIDVSQQDDLKLLGRKKVQASPFEMYVRDSIVYALYNGYGEYIEGEQDGYWNWIQTSYVMAFDTTDPKNPSIVGKFPIAGSISDSRIVGDILYVVGFENGSCWNCETGQRTTVLSLNVASPANIEKADQLSFVEDTTGAYSWSRSISVNSQRMYVAGPSWGANGAPVGSEIQVIDISNPAGDLIAGAKVSVAGTINSRWQMDEYDGYLRVISQPNAWDLTTPVSIQTFAVADAQSITPKANVELTGVPEGETLRSVRFDEKRAYAITARQMDPLFTVDLSNPLAPKQGGSLEMPGWVYHMEPRGERVVALGFDQGNAAGALTVSLFDVSDLSSPTMIERINFGGNWAWVSEGQDQIHKAFQVLDEANLILMPFSGWDYSEDSCAGKSTNGIQLIDWFGDNLTLQGVASLVGQPRRGFLYDDRLFAVSEERVETYNIVDRSQPKRTQSLKTAENVSQTIVAGDTLVKLTTDWYSNTVGIDTTTLANVESPETMGHLDLAIGSNQCNYSYLGTVTATEDRLYLMVNEYDYTSSTGKYASRIVTVDVSSPSQPKILGQANLDFGEGWSYWYGGTLVSAGQTSVAVGDAFVMLATESVQNSNGYSVGTKSVAHVLDMSDPSNPSDTRFEVPSISGTTGLFTSGSTVAFGYYTASPTDSERVRFYANRIDVSNPAQPKAMAPVNVPGSLIAFDAKSSNAMTADYEAVTIKNVSNQDCYTKYGSWEFVQNENDEVGTCSTMRHTVNLVKLGERFASLLGSKQLDKGQGISQVAQGEDRLFITGGNSYGYRYAIAGDVAMGSSTWGGYWYGFNQGELPLFVAAGLSSGEFSLGSLNLKSGNNWYGTGPMVASGQRVLFSSGWQGELVVVDGAVATEPAIVQQIDIPGYVSDLSVKSGVGIASMGYDGVTTVRIE